MRSLLRDKGCLSEEYALLFLYFVTNLHLDGELWCVLIDVGLCASRRCHNSLDEARHLGHNIHAVILGAQGTAYFGCDLLAVVSLASPVIAGRRWLRPIVIRVLLGLEVLDIAVNASSEQLAVCSDTTNADDGRSVRRGSLELHEDCGVRRRLEVDEVPTGSYARLVSWRANNAYVAYRHGGASFLAEHG